MIEIKLLRVLALSATAAILSILWAPTTAASLVETCKLKAVDPPAWLTDVLTKLVNLWAASRIDELMPWVHAAGRP